MALKSGRGDRQKGSGLLPPALTQRPRLAIAAALLCAALAVFFGSLVGDTTGERVGSGLSPPGPKPPPAPPKTAQTPDRPAAGFTRFRQRRGLFTIDYPTDWRRLDARGSGVDLLAARGEAASVLVRSIPLRYAVGRAQLREVEALTDRIVASGREVRLLAEVRQVELGGLHGYFYFYSFSDPRTARRGTHSHYFLFRGTTLITIVLQALPESRFERFS